MRYHYQRGATKTKKRGVGRIKLGVTIVIIVGLAGYGTFLSVLPGLGGWPYKRGDETAKKVRTTAPGNDGNRLYIPKINVAAAVASGSIELDGEFGSDKKTTLRGERLSLALTPQATLEKSAFSRLNQLQEGDELFVDYNGTRYAYSITNGSDGIMTLETKDKSVSVSAKPIGVVAWNGGEPRIEAIN